MNNDMLERIRLDIRNNFCKALNWDKIPKGNFNCYMFAVSNTVPTEVFDYNKDGNTYLRSLISENVAYFGDIGQISGKKDYTNVTELIYALKCDLETLGISMEVCSLKKVVQEQCVKIAFYYNIADLENCKHSTFHFLREENGAWMHKDGWTGDLIQLEQPIEGLSITGMELVGYFQLSLRKSFR